MVRKRYDSVKRFLNTHFVSSFYTALLTFIAFQIWYLYQPVQGGIALSFFITGVVLVTSVLTGIYYGYREKQEIRKRLGDISAYIKVLSRSNFSQRKKANDEIEEELNRLAEKFQKQVQSLQKLADEKAELADRAKSAATVEERQRLARDLHDAVSQQLFALSMMSSSSLRLLDRDVESAKSQMEDVAEIASKAQGEMRALLLHLRPVHLSGDPLHTGIQKLVDELKSKSGIDFDLDISEVADISKGVEDHLFRMIQEGMANALRHADATKIKVQLYRQSNHLILHIRDNGKGFDVSQSKKASYGLKTMQERCNEIGGALNVTSKPGEGTAIDIRVPVKQRRD